MRYGVKWRTVSAFCSWCYDADYVLSAKYPLALVNQVLDVLQDRPGLGYDIGCSFTETVAKSSIAEKARGKGLRLVVPSFHGYAHKRICQLSYHPLFAGGFGIEDLETAERIFSSFNGLANITRYASRYHRHQAIDLYARQHDDDKYQELCAFWVMSSLFLTLTIVFFKRHSFMGITNNLAKFSRRPPSRLPHFSLARPSKTRPIVNTSKLSVRTFCHVKRKLPRTSSRANITSTSSRTNNRSKITSYFMVH
jgi:Kyakuja-Dileera-Zisupton transposase